MTSYVTTGLMTIVLILFGIVAYVVARKMINDTVGFFLDSFSEIFETTPVKKAMSVLGKKSAESRVEKKLVDDMATKVLSSPQAQAVKMALSAIGIDAEEYIEQYGAVQTIAAARQLAAGLGIDLSQVLSQGLNKGVSGNKITNPYLGVNK